MAIDKRPPTIHALTISLIIRRGGFRIVAHVMVMVGNIGRVAASLGGTSIVHPIRSGTIRHAGARFTALPF